MYGVSGKLSFSQDIGEFSSLDHNMFLRLAANGRKHYLVVYCPLATFRNLSGDITESCG